MGHLTKILRVFTALLLAVAITSSLAAQTSDPLAAEPRNRIVAFGDVHGGAAELRSLLTAMHLIDEADNWTGGQTRLVSLGDLLDRGPASRSVMDLLMKLEAQAAASGGRLYMVLGNHEIMNLVGDLRYVSAQEYAAFAAEEDPQVRETALDEFRQAQAKTLAGQEGTSSRINTAAPSPESNLSAFNERFPPGYFAHRAAFSADGHYGRWLLNKPQILELEGMAFVHGGLSEGFSQITIEQFNREANAQLQSLLTLGERLQEANGLPSWSDFLTATPMGPNETVPEELETLRGALQFQPDGPTWYRGTATCHPLIERPRFEAVLHSRGLKRVIMGHTPTNPRIPQGRFENRALLADTGMYRAYYRGRPSALVFSGGEVKSFTLTDEGVQRIPLGRTAVDVRVRSETELTGAIVTALAGAPLSDGEAEEVTATGRRMNATWRRERAAQRNARLAAHALDKQLGLGLVAPVTAHAVNDKGGTLEILPASAITETERVAQNRYRPNNCSRGSDYELMLVLDALIGQPTRNSTNVWYDRATWVMYLVDHGKSFPSSKKLPEYVLDRLSNQRTEIPPLLAEQLAKLTVSALEDSLGEYLENKQLQAILGRRDRLLEAWPAKL